MLFSWIFVSTSSDFQKSTWHLRISDYIHVVASYILRYTTEVYCIPSKSVGVHCVNQQWTHYSDVIMNAMASQFTSLAIIYSTVYSNADQRKHQSSASLAFVREFHRWSVNSPHKGTVTRTMFPFDDVIMQNIIYRAKRISGTRQKSFIMI